MTILLFIRNVYKAIYSLAMIKYVATEVYFWLASKMIQETSYRQDVNKTMLFSYLVI